MSDKKDLLVELGTEELPPKALMRLSDAFASGIKAGLEKANLSFGEVKQYASPRRLAVIVNQLDITQSSKEVVRRGPALTAAFGDDGCPTPAAEGFARSCGVSVDALDRMETDKGSWLIFNSTETGLSAPELMPDIVENALNKLPIPKRMRWSDLSVEFVRPAHWLVMLFGEDVINADILNVKAGRETFGHRFHHPGALHIADAAAYAPLLQTEGHVIADFDIRRQAIRAQILEAAASVNGQAVVDTALLDEVTGMVEWPVAILGKFDAEFLTVPPEALISVMKGHQKYFPVIDSKGGLMPCFITIANIESSDPDQVRRGNERVIRPRLADAVFFWQKDAKHTLASRLDKLKDVVYQKQLGTLFDKSQRIAGLAMVIATKLGADKQLAERASILSKCDLLSEMVGEFPELQGVIGSYYAKQDGEPDEISIAINEHHMPRFAGDALPATATGQAVAIADKLDTLVGIFGIGQVPSGDKDPFGLRRSALGVLRIIIEKELDIDLPALIDEAIKSYQKNIKAKDLPDLEEQVYDFMMDRLRTYYIDRNIPADVFESVSVQRHRQPYDFDRRINAVAEFCKLPEAESLAAANKRISNIILKQADDNAASNIQSKIDSSLLEDNVERTLAGRVSRMEKEVKPLFEAKDYAQALQSLATLKEPVDSYFESVMVMADDINIRNNRLALINKIRNLFLQVADLSKLQG
ncbi:MAG: glycine--tRNA ligase subunit beta [Gammaproteobacteria bacterium]|nr:glycine--tRNA ligase subunit beta [Gammaproteobacteria bacterium]